MKKILGILSFAFTAAFAGQAHATLIATGSVGADALSTGFSGCSAGALTSGCTGLPLLGISLIGNTNATGDRLDSGASGNAIGVRNGQVQVIPLNGLMDDELNLSGFRFTFSSTFTQFGFRVVDQGGLKMRVTGGDGSFLTFDNGNSVPFAIRRFDSSVALTSFDLICTAGCAGYAVDDLMIAGLGQIAQVPEPGSVALLGLGLMGLFAARRNKRA